MNGETDLTTLLKTMVPKLLDIPYVFITLPNGQYGDGIDLEPIAMFQEQEGLTLVIPENKARSHNYRFESTFRCISLTVHSSLTAVGLTAAIANKLQSHNISANVIAGFFHDHIFVPTKDANNALIALSEFE